MNRFIVRICCVFVLSIICTGGMSRAAVVTFRGETASGAGTSLSNGLGLLALQDKNPGSDGMQAGSVLWNGSDDVFGSVGNGVDTKTSQSQTRSVAELSAKEITVDTLAVALTLSQQGSSDALNLHNFTLRFQNAAGATLFDAPYDASGSGNNSTSSLTPTGQGSGSSGYLFRVSFSGSEGTNFFATSGNRIGLFINNKDAMSGATGGAETFYVLAAPVPEPASIGCITLGVALLSARRRSSIRSLRH